MKCPGIAFNTTLSFPFKETFIISCMSYPPFVRIVRQLFIYILNHYRFLCNIFILFLFSVYSFEISFLNMQLYFYSCFLINKEAHPQGMGYNNSLFLMRKVVLKHLLILLSELLLLLNLFLKL